jgi:hypothetical protein
MRPAPHDQYLQELRTTALNSDHPVSIFHDSWLSVIREDDQLLLQVGCTIDAGLIFVCLYRAQADQVYLKTPDLNRNNFPSEWFCIGKDFDAFLKRLHYVAQ